MSEDIRTFLFNVRAKEPSIKRSVAVWLERDRLRVRGFELAPDGKPYDDGRRYRPTQPRGEA